MVDDDVLAGSWECGNCVGAPTGISEGQKATELPVCTPSLSPSPFPGRPHLSRREARSYRMTHPLSAGTVLRLLRRGWPCTLEITGTLTLDSLPRWGSIYD